MDAQDLPSLQNDLAPTCEGNVTDRVAAEAEKPAICPETYHFAAQLAHRRSS